MRVIRCVFPLTSLCEGLINDPLLETRRLLPQAAKVGAQAQLVRNCRALLKRLTTEVEISKAITGFPTVRLPIDVSGIHQVGWARVWAFSVVCSATSSEIYHVTGICMCPLSAAKLLPKHLDNHFLKTCMRREHPLQEKDSRFPINVVHQIRPQPSTPSARPAEQILMSQLAPSFYHTYSIPSWYRTPLGTVTIDLLQTKQPMPKDYWQPEDNGHIEETEGFPLPPVDADGKNLDYVWVPSKSLRALSAACKRMSEALVGGEVMSRHPLYFLKRSGAVLYRSCATSKRRPPTTGSAFT